MVRKTGRPSLEAKAQKEALQTQVAALDRVVAKGEQVAGIQKAVRLMEQVPEMVPTIITTLQQAVKDRSPGGLLERWPRNYYKVHKIGPVFMEGWIKKAMMEMPKDFWPRMRLVKRKVGDKDYSETELLFYFAVDLLPDMDLTCDYKRVFSELLNQRHESKGKRLANIVVADNTVDWSKSGHYSFLHRGEGSKITHVQHISGVTVPAPGALAMFDDWEIERNWWASTALAKSKKTGVSVPLLDLFDQAAVTPKPMEELAIEFVTSTLTDLKQKQLQQERAHADKLAMQEQLAQSNLEALQAVEDEFAVTTSPAKRARGAGEPGCGSKGGAATTPPGQGASGVPSDLLTQIA